MEVNMVVSPRLMLVGVLLFGGIGSAGASPCGSPRSVASSTNKTPTPLASGYATFGDDSGHQSKSITDGSFAANDEALANYGGLSLKKTHDVALALITRAYGKAPLRMYFQGNSQGGHEGLIVVQRWPQDYDGVIAIPADGLATIDLRADSWRGRCTCAGSQVGPGAHAKRGATSS